MIARGAFRLLRAAFGTLGPIAPVLMGRVAFWLWFRPRRGRESAAAAPVLQRADRTWVAGDRGRCAVYAWGDRRAPRVLLVHGWSGRTSQMSALVDPLVRAGFRVVALDAPAHGRSEGAKTDVFEICRALSRLEAEAGPFTGVVAHSMGVLVCATALSTDALHVARAVCIAPAVRRETLLAGFAASLGLPDRVIDDLAARVDAFAGPRFWERTVIAAPTLIIHDMDDDFIPIRDAEAMARTWPDAVLVKTRGLGHFGILSDPAVGDRIIPFLNSRSS